MQAKISTLLDRMSEFIATRKGLLPLVGIGFILLNLVFQIFPVGWLTSSNFFLHLGVILAILGLMFAWAL
ncbi:MAG TPA: hypothetical protein VMT46_18970 [Anaerolineaceae bacterium]|nr:hypothetical protein [Anaerolineaceae bacterium]